LTLTIYVNRLGDRSCAVTAKAVPGHDSSSFSPDIVRFDSEHDANSSKEFEKIM